MVVRSDFARNLERELTATTEQRDRLAIACDQYIEIYERTKQRDEAREAADKWEKIAHDKLSEVCRQIEKTRFVTEQRDRAAERLRESNLQLQYLDEKYPSGTTPTCIIRNDKALQSLTPKP
jgi:DNA repair exonuclease SbcCD ATPase subunit